MDSYYSSVQIVVEVQEDTESDLLVSISSQLGAESGAIEDAVGGRESDGTSKAF